MMQYGTPVYGPPIMQYGPPPKKKTKKRVAVVAAVAAAGLASAGVYATALTVTANKDAAGTSDAVASCDPDGVNVTTGNPVWDDDGHKYYFATVTVTGIDLACNGQTVYVQPLTIGDAALGGGGNAVYLKGGSNVTTVQVTLTGSKAFVETYLKASVAIHQPAA